MISWLDVGIGYTIDAEKPIWGARFQPISESDVGWRPGLMLGTGSVQTGGRDQSVFIQLTKSWESSEGYVLRLSGGVAGLVPDFDGLENGRARVLTSRGKGGVGRKTRISLTHIFHDFPLTLTHIIQSRSRRV